MSSIADTGLLIGILGACITIGTLLLRYVIRIEKTLILMKVTRDEVKLLSDKVDEFAIILFELKGYQRGAGGEKKE